MILAVACVQNRLVIETMVESRVGLERKELIYIRLV